jgi:outer membrane protein OmpU
MKKVLLTTSALTLLAGAAAADVSVGGYARLGISNSGSATSNYLRNQLTFSGSTTTDGGLTMSGWTRWRNSASSSKFGSTAAFASPQLSISNGAMTLTAGNAAGAIGANSGLWGCGAVMWGCADVVNGSFDWASTSHSSTGPDVVRLDMSLGGSSISVSGGNGNDTEASISMSLGGGNVGIGYDAGTNPTTSINYSGSMAGMGVGLRMAQVSGGNTGYMANVSAPMAAGSVYVFAGKTVGASNNYGIRYNQSLGGGASMQAGVTSAGGATTVGAGVHFGF